MQANNKGVSHTPPKTWKKIRDEYVGSNASMRELSRKYGISVSCISDKAKKEGWKELKAQINEKAEQKIVESLSDKQASNTEKAMEILNNLMDKLNDAVKHVNTKDVGTMKSLVTSMKDLRDIGVFEVKKAEADGIKIEMGGTEDYAD